MKICILGHYPPHIGGVSSHTYHLSQELIKRGDEVFILTYPHPDIKDYNGIHIETAPTVNIKGLRGLIFFITATIKLISMTRKYDIDIIHAHYILPPGLIAIIANTVTHRKTAVTVHGSDINILASNALLKNLIKYVLKRADYIAVVDENIKDKVLKLNIGELKSEIKVTPNSVNTDKYKPNTQTTFTQDVGLNPEKPVILFVGNLVHQKGLKYLLQAKKLLKTDAQLVIVGDGPLRSELEELVEKQTIPDVIFTGARRDIDKIMPTAQVFTLPSITEGLPITLLEALSSGLPVVATQVGGIPGLITDEVGLLVKPGDSKVLAEALDKILSNKKLRDEMSEKARLKALKYSTLEIPY